ncbi:FMN-dependent dehydrogenase-domain-containing protein [Russula earlei]|uniref:FMN-dependent dehydrogenase-domain-containing protein n=1 Tax=Russula earlei TaxID=71964 RepID=A0ACC0UKK4_9AGAM|nr:FMN-dependent dehydrogenase-domain-containing protein [Russula earlei]
MCRRDVVLPGVGQVTRGMDVLKALCLGAHAVGLRQVFLYANSIWGEEGCMHGIEIMQEEIELGMRLLGVTRLEESRPERVQFVDHARLGL